MSNIKIKNVLAEARVADLVAQYIVEELELETVFAVTGAGIMHLTDGLAKESRLRTIFPHHEQTSSMAVDAFSRYSSKIGVSFYSTGPAATNAVTGLAGCWQDSVAAIFISGQVKRAESTAYSQLPQVRQFGVQELNILPVVSPITKYAKQIDDPLQVLYELDKAAYLARSGRPGPVWLEIPMDVQGSIVDKKAMPRFTPPSETQEPKIDIQQLLNLLETSLRPVIVAGQGVRISGSIDSFIEFVESTKIPFVTPYLGVDIALKSHPQNIGVTGVKGDRTANWAMQYCDLLLVMGSSMHVSVTGYEYPKFSTDSQKVLFDIDENAHKKGNINFDLSVIGDLRLTLGNLASNVSFQKEEWRGWAARLKETSLEHRVVETSPKDFEGVSIYSAVEAVNAGLKKNDCVISDAGSAFYAIAQAISLSHKSQRYITSGAMATMGFSLPAAIGAISAGAERVLAFTGDGSLQQNIQELSVMRQNSMNIKLLVLNNAGYLSIRASQNNYYDGRLFGTGPEAGLHFPDLKKICEAYSLEYIQVKNREDLVKLMTNLEVEGPVVVEIQCPPNEPIVPTLGSKLSKDGTLSSASLEDMTPNLSEMALSGIKTFLIGK